MTARRFIPVLAVASLILLGCDKTPTAPQSADRPSFITHGELDGNSHPAVVLIVMDVGGQPAFRCSGTLIAPKVVLTAGHCAGEPGEFSGMRIFTESDVENGNNNYPFAGPNTIEAEEWHAHPLFTESAFFLHDVGVIRLTQSVRAQWDLRRDRRSLPPGSSECPRFRYFVPELSGPSRSAVDPVSG